MVSSSPTKPLSGFLRIRRKKMHKKVPAVCTRSPAIHGKYPQCNIKDVTLEFILIISVFWLKWWLLIVSHMQRVRGWSFIKWKGGAPPAGQADAHAGSCEISRVWVLQSQSALLNRNSLCCQGDRLEMHTWDPHDFLEKAGVVTGSPLS